MVDYIGQGGQSVERPETNPPTARILFSEVIGNTENQIALELEIAKGQGEHPIAEMAQYVMEKIQGVLMDDPRATDVKTGQCAVGNIPVIDDSEKPYNPVSVRFDRQSAGGGLPRMRDCPEVRNPDDTDEKLLADLEKRGPDYARSVADRMEKLLASTIELFIEYGLQNVLASIGKLMVIKAARSPDPKDADLRECYTAYGKTILEISKKVS